MPNRYERTLFLDFGILCFLLGTFMFVVRLVFISIVSSILWLIGIVPYQRYNYDKQYSDTRNAQFIGSWVNVQSFRQLHLPILRASYSLCHQKEQISQTETNSANEGFD
jgi:hypothetical protein